MNASSSRPPDERFAEWVDGCMSPRDRERFEAELRVSATLRAELAAYERTVATLREALQAPTAPTALADRVLAAVQAASSALPSPSGSRPRRSFGAYLFGGLAAAALMGMAVWFDAWVTPNGEVDKMAQVDHDRLAAPPSAAAPVAGSGGRSDVPAAEKEAEPGVELRLRTDAAKVSPDEAEDAESEKRLDQPRDEAGRDKSDADDAKAKAQVGTFGAPENVVTAGVGPEGQAPRPEAAEGEIPGREAVVPVPAAPLAPAPVVPGGAVGRVPDGTGAAPGDPGAAKPEAVRVAPDQAGVGLTAPGAPAGGRAAPPPSEGAPVVGSRGVPAPSPAAASPFVGPLPLLTVERSAPSVAVPPPSTAGGGTKGDESLARFADGAQAELAQLVDRFLATAGAGAGEEIVWRTARGSLVLRAIDPALVAQPGERDARRADSATTPGSGEASTVPLPAPRTWVIVGDSADIEVLLGRLGAKVRAEGWKLQTGEFEGPKPRQGPATAGPARPATGQAAAQRSLLLQFRFVR
jgi:hypothetical protein